MIRVQDRVAQLATGDEIEVVCTDPGVLNDIPAWCRLNGHQVLETRQANGEYVVVLRVGSNPV